MQTSSSSKTNKFAIAAASRVNPQVVGIAPGIISAIIAAVLPILLGKLNECLPASQRKSPTHEQQRRKLETAYNSDPQAVRQAVAKDIMREGRRQGEKMSKLKALQLADGTIHQGLQTPALDWSL